MSPAVPSVALPDPAQRSAQLPDAIELLLSDGSRRTVYILDAGLACCAVEVGAAVARQPAHEGQQRRQGPDVLVISGTVTDVLAPRVRELYLSMRPVPQVLSFGACANTGGPYWDSYSVTNGIDQVVPVDVYVPGCPPRPEALLAGLLALAR